MSELAGSVVAITGASSGIGEAAAKLLAASGAKVLLGARRHDRLEAITQGIANAGGGVEIRHYGDSALNWFAPMNEALVRETVKCIFRRCCLPEAAQYTALLRPTC